MGWVMHTVTTTDGIRHTITCPQVLAELARYDAAFPANDYDERAGGPGWLDAPTYRFALVHEGRLYPPKYLLHRLTAAPLERFSGGEFTNRVLRRLGFEVLPKGAALERQARRLREAAPPYAAPGVLARVADLPAVPAVYCMCGG